MTATPMALDGYEEWKAEALAQIKRMAADGIEFTADDLRRVVGPPPNGKVTGAIFRAAHADRLIVKTAYQPSSTPSRHGSVLYRWKGNPDYFKQDQLFHAA